MTESELAKVRELVASQRELLSLWLHGDAKATEAMMERRRRAFLAVEAMVSPPSRDWTEDFGGENGNYQNRCVECGEHFIGYKRRIMCRVCAEKPTPAPEPQS